MSELPQAFLHLTPVARKEHKCCECRGLILVGDTYHRFSGVWDGEPATYKVCPPCQSLREEMDADISDPIERTPFTCLEEYALEARGEDFYRRFIWIKINNGAVVTTTMRERAGIEAV